MSTFPYLLLIETRSINYVREIIYCVIRTNKERLSDSFQGTIRIDNGFEILTQAPPSLLVFSSIFLCFREFETF